MSDVPRRLSIVLLTVVLALCVYRARTQSFTVDEAWVFNSFVNQDLAVMGHTYDACNHVLHTLLMKLSRHYLGTGELALRVPGLIGALLYAIAVYKLTRLVLGGWTQLLAVALLTLHPLVLDFMVAARGYGFALGLFTLAVYCSIVYHVRGFVPKWLSFAGVFAGLSIAANLVTLVPCVALGLVLLALAGREGPGSFWTVVDRYGGPAILTAFLILIVPLLPARPEHFYFGKDSLAGSVESLVDSVIKVPQRWPASSYEALTPAIAIAVSVLLAVLGVGFVGAVVAYTRKAGPVPFRLTPYAITSGTLFISALLVILMHVLLGMKYPFGRTGLYFVPLFFSSVLLGLRSIENRRWEWLRTGGHVLGILTVVIFILQTDNRYFEDWLYDAGTGKLIRVMHEDFEKRVQAGQNPATLGTSLFVNQTVNYYRVRRRLDWLAAPETGKLESKRYDYYLLYGDDLALMDKLHLQLVQQDRLSREALARRSE